MFCIFQPAQVLQVGPAQDVLPLRIHRDNMFVSGEAWRLFKQAHPEQDFSDFWLEASLKFSIGCFDLSSCFFLCKKSRSASSTSRSTRIPKTEPLSPLAGSSDFAYASDVGNNNVRKPGHVVELSF
jgi:hypothetical protein